MAKVLIIAEHHGPVLNVATARTVACAKAIQAQAIEVAVFAKAGGELAEAAAKLEGVSKVLLIEHPANEYPLASLLAPQIIALAEGYSHILAPSTTFGKDLLPRVAARLGVPQITDIMRVESPRLFERPIYAGNAVVTVEASEQPILGTVRTASFKAVAETGSAPVEKIDLAVELPVHTRFEGLQTQQGERPDLQSAQVVVAGGRGVGSQEKFQLLFHLADKLGAAVGASRAAVDAGLVPNDLQVGQTGKIIAPDLYMAFGISGAIQHLAGIKDAGTIVAVNSDPDAPIFEVADIGLVGDLMEIIPKLEAVLEKK